MIAFLRNSVTGRVMAVILLGLAISQALSLMIRQGDEDQALGTLETVRIAERIAMMVELVENTPPAQRVALIAVLNRPMLPVRLEPSPIVPSFVDSEETRLLNRTLADRLHKRKAFNIRMSDRSYDTDNWIDRSRLIPLLHDESGVAHADEIAEIARDIIEGRHFRVSVQLSDLTWLNFVAPFAESLTKWAPRSIIALSAIVVIVIGVSVWAVRRLTAPVEALAAAAQRLGVDVNAPPLPEQGPHEVRQAARAFNQMQQRIQRLLQDRTQMLAAISHDLRTPITRLRLRGEFVEDPVQQSKMLADLEQMETIISSALAFAKEEASAEAVRVVDFVALVQSICDGMAETGLPVTFAGEGRLTYVCRPVSMRRCFTNLIDNAVRYGSCAHVALTVEKGWIRLDVDDKGPGIPEALHEQVFHPFYRIEASRSRDTGGTGLGLTVARAVVHSHGGEISLKNLPQGGLRVEVVLPLASDGDHPSSTLST